jgi:transglutaminase-like putative cysteine protease
MTKLARLTGILFFVLMAATSWAKSQSGVITMNFDLSGHKPGEEARLWIPYPMSDKNQVICDVKVSGNFAESAVYSDRVYTTPMLFARWDKGAKDRKLTLTFAVTRDEVLRRDFPEKEAPWSPADYKELLSPSHLAPLAGPVKELAAKITKGKTTVKDKAKAIYDWTVENMYRDPATRGCGIGDVCALIDKPGGKCADIHSVYVALARAAGVPAREVFGIRQGKKDGQDISTWQHCWAEFFLPGYGWVPVDAADVRKMMLTQKLELKDPKTVEYRKYFWGGIDPYRVKLSVGRDLTLNPAQKGPAVNYLMYPFAQIGDQTLDWLDPKTFKYSFTWKSK